MKTLKNMVLTATLLTLGGTMAGCTAFESFNEVESLNNAQAIGSPFTQSLASEYRDYANNELKNMFDYADALHFARKGLAAASGEVVLPEPVSDWNLSEMHLQELGAARGRLIVAYDLGAREIAPELAALTQAKFDCWIEGQEETWGDGDFNACKAEFFDALNQLEASLQVPAPIMIEEPIIVSPFDVDETQPMAVENAMYLVFFNWDSSKLSTGAQSVIDAIVQEVAANPPSSILLTGHTDTSGSAIYNQRLALKRANMAKDALVKAGVPADLIEVTAMGEKELLVETPDNVREPANRRVNISFN